MASTWTRFGVSPSDPIDVSIFKPLLARNADPLNQDYRAAVYGRIAESPGECVLVVDWQSPQIYDAFKESPQYEELQANMRASSGMETEPQTNFIFMHDTGSWMNMEGPNTEIRTVYFPKSISREKQGEINRITPLKLSVGFGMDGRSQWFYPYRRLPNPGWVRDTQKWKGEDASACIWVHYWKSKEGEDKLKSTERRLMRANDRSQPLVLDVFEKTLKDMGALGWEIYHGEFTKMPNRIP
jgi:hypothetical protein